MPKPPSRRNKATSAASTDSTSAANSVNEDISLQEDPASATITVTAVEVPELTEQEISDRLHLERKVERAFFEAGKALAQLRDRRLYRSTHRTFEEYCRDLAWILQLPMILLRHPPTKTIRKSQFAIRN